MPLPAGPGSASCLCHLVCVWHAALGLDSEALSCLGLVETVVLMGGLVWLSGREPCVIHMCVSAVVQSVRFYSLWVVLSRQVLKFVLFRKFYLIPWRSLRKDQGIQDSHFFKIHLKPVRFLLAGPLTCHQAGLCLKQNLKLLVAYICLILVKDKASNAVFHWIH